MNKKQISIFILIAISFFSIFLTGCEKDTVEQLKNEYGAIVDGGSFKKDSVLITNEIDKTTAKWKEAIDKISEIDYDKESEVYVYEIYVAIDDVKVQPKGVVKVTIPLLDPEIDSGIILHVKDNDQIEKIIPTISNGKLTFETSSFSYFILVRESAIFECIHEWTEWETAKEPTCEENGKQSRTCPKCKNTEYEDIEALGHDTITHDAKEATCSEPGHNAYEECTRCDYSTYEEIPVIEHDLVKHDGKAATCEEPGHKAYEECTRCDHTTYEEIPALGHDLVKHNGKDATCAEVGYYDYAACTRCDYSTYEEIPSLSHEYASLEIEPTCTNKGYTIHICTNCKGSYIDNYKDALVHDIVEHKGKAATCTEVGYKDYETCKNCNHTTYEEIPALGHDLVKHNGKDATCLEAGHNAYEECTRCDHTTYEEIPALDHNLEKNVGKNPTCLEPGYHDYVKCTRCDYSTYEEIPALGHDIVEHDAKDATCSEPGHNAYEECTRCNYTTYEEIPALGHDNVKHDAKEATCLEAGHNAYEECTRCDHTTYEEIPALDHNLEKNVGKNPTCLEPGYHDYVKCTRCDYSTYEEIPALGHDIVKHDAKDATCSEPGHKAYEECTRCDYSTYEEIPALGHDIVKHDAKDATCSEPGHKAYEECTRCDYSTYEEIPALGHDNVEHDAKDATCSEAGYKAYEECTRCDYTTYEEIPALGHDIVEHDAKDATCSEPGHKAYEECTRCDYSTYEEIPALGHDIVEHDAKDATCSEPGHNAYEECTRCDYTTYEEIPTLEHNFGDIEVTKKPTCTEVGKAEKTCINCEETVEVDVDMIDHAYGEWVIKTESTCSVHGIMERTCLVCENVETGDAPLAYHTWGDYYVYKKPTLEEEGIERCDCTKCDAYSEYPLEKLRGYTVTVSGGTVNRKGENKNQNTIYVAEGEIVEIVANNYEGYTFYQWFSDGTEVIPTTTFELYVTRNSLFFICFEEGLDYGEWVLEQEKTCTTDGIYSRTDKTTGLKQYMISFARGHDIVEHDAKDATCTEPGKKYYECTVCEYKEEQEISPLGHNFSGEEVIIEEAYGAKVGTKEISCTRCDAKTTKQYIKAAYPKGNLKIDFTWDHRAYVSSADRTEIHWQLDEAKYCFYIMRESSGHSSGNYVHFYFYYEDNGPQSPVYVRKMVGDKYYTQQNRYGTYGWGIVGYVDSYDEFIEFIDDEFKGNDNGLNNSGLHTIYKKWEDIFNEYGRIPSSYYCDGITEYLGYTCRIYSNGDFFYYVNEDNCCLYYAGLNTNRDQAYVEDIEEITEIPHGPVEFEKVKYIMIDIVDGSDGKFADQYYFQIENLNQNVEIRESSYIPKRFVVVGYEVQLLDGTWAKIEELELIHSEWCNEDDYTYMNIIEDYFNGVYPECLKIRAIKEEADLPVHVEVINGYASADPNSTNYGSDNNFLANEEIVLWPEYDETKYTIDYWKLTINGEVTEVREEYIYTHRLTLPASGEVLAECVLKEISSVEVPVTINIIGEGKANITSGSYSEHEPLSITAISAKGYVFVGWFVQGMYYMPEGDMGMPSGSFSEEYYDYGEYFGSTPIYSFNLYNRYDDIIITLIFEEIDLEKDYIDILVTDGFVSSYSYTALHVSALRITSPEYYDIHGTFEEDENISGWIVTEDLGEGPVDTQIEGKYGGHYFTVDSTVKPVNATE